MNKKQEKIIFTNIFKINTLSLESKEKKMNQKLQIESKVK